MEPSTFGFLMSLLFGNLFAATLAGGIITYNSKKLTPQKYMMLEMVNHSLSILGYFACVVVAVVNYVNAVRLHGNQSQQS